MASSNMTTMVELPSSAPQSCGQTTLLRTNSLADIEMMAHELRDGDVEMTVARGELDGDIEMVDGDTGNDDVEMGDWEVCNTENVGVAEDVEMVDGDTGNGDVEMGDLEVRNIENVDADMAEDEPTGEDVEMVDGDRTNDVEIQNA